MAARATPTRRVARIMTAEPRPVVGEVVHAHDCAAPRLVRRDGTRVAVISCTSCHAWTTVPRRSEWRDTPQPEEQP